MRRTSIILTAATVASIASHAAAAQSAGQIKQVQDGDGRIHGGPVLPVSTSELQTGQVTIINLHPRYHAVLEFPYPVAQVHAGDPDVFSASIVGNKLTLKATKVLKAETTMTVMLGDADMTLVPFLVRADSTQPFVYIIRYTDPVSLHLNQAETAIANRLKSDADNRVEDLAEKRLDQRLLMAGDLVKLSRSETVGKAGEQITLSVESAQTLPGADGRPRLYIRYRVKNGTVAPLSDLALTLAIHSTKRRNLVFESADDREIYDFQDVRSAAVIPAGGTVTGLLILDDLDLRGSNEALAILGTAFAAQRHIRIDDVLVGRDH